MKTTFKEYSLRYNPNFNEWECINQDGKRMLGATTKTECFLKATQQLKGVIIYGEHLTPEEEERDMQNACFMHKLQREVLE